MCYFPLTYYLLCLFQYQYMTQTSEKHFLSVLTYTMQPVSCVQSRFTEVYSPVHSRCMVWFLYIFEKFY